MNYNVTLQQISYFLEVADRLNITAVAENNYISQPALSKAIKRLEDAMQVKLFTKSGRNITLTNQGASLYKKIREPFDEMTAALDSVYSRNQVIRLAFPSPLLLNPYYRPLTTFLMEYKISHPEVPFTENICEMDELVSGLQRHEYDIVFLHSFMMDQLDGAQNIPILPMKSYVAVSKAVVGDAEGEELIRVLNRTKQITISNTRNQQHTPWARPFLDDLGLHGAGTETVANFTTMLYKVCNGDGYGVFGSVEFDRDDIIRIPLNNGEQTHSICAVWFPQDVSFDIDQFLRKLREAFKAAP